MAHLPGSHLSINLAALECKEWISLLGQIIVFGGLVFGAIKFANEKKRDFPKRFFDEQLKVFNEAVDNASSILLYEKYQFEYRLAKNNFDRLFWGKMCIVEDREVEAKMVNLKTLLEQYDKESNSSSLAEIKAKLQQASLILAHTCRNTCLQTWGIKNKANGSDDYTLRYEKETME